MDENTKEKFLLCRPSGGMNDIFCQIEKCWQYAEKFKRTLIIDTNRTGSGIFGNFSAFFTQRIHSDSVFFELTESQLQYLNTLTCIPEVLQGRLDTYTSIYSSEHKPPFIEKETSVPISFDFNKDYNAPLLVHEQPGGGTLSENFLNKIIISENIISQVLQNIRALGSNYSAIHVRNTDYRTHYEDFFNSLYPKLSGKSLLICSDDANVVSYAKNFFDLSRVITSSYTPQMHGKQLHRQAHYANDQQRKNATCNSIIDLIALSGANEFYSTNVTKGFPSGFSRLALYLFNNKNIRSALLGLNQPPIELLPEPFHRGKNPAFHPAFAVPPVWGKGNDYRHILESASLFRASDKPYTRTVSIIIPVYNRHQLLANTLAAITHQTYPQALTEIIVVDDGSSDEVLAVIRKYEKKLKLHYVRQADDGYRLSAACNLGVRFARGECIVIMDADILSLTTDIENYMCALHVTDNAVLLGHRKYVDVSGIKDDAILASMDTVMRLPAIHPDNDVAGCKNAAGESIDWRFLEYEKTDDLRNALWPFRCLVGATFALPRSLLNQVGEFDEDFNAWGCEDGEFGYRLYNAGAYFVPMLDVIALHQEPLQEVAKTGDGSYRKAGYEITRQIRARKCAAPPYRNDLRGNDPETPKVSIYIPAYNAERYIVAAVQSCLNQDFADLEVCICNDGSTDNTLGLLEEHFANTPQVRWISQENAGIGSATNAAIKLCQGMYIGQLDADDLLKADAVKECVAVLDTMPVDAVYTDREYVDEEGNFIRNAPCLGVYSREWILTGMRVTHFRMFRKRLWSRISGCDETLKKAVDFDLWLKLSEVGDMYHLHKVLYGYRWHGGNTSILHRKQQEQNHLKVVSAGLERLGLDQFWQVQSSCDPLNPRDLQIVPTRYSLPSIPENIFILLPLTAKQLANIASIDRFHLWELERMGFRYLFVIGKPEIRIMRVEQDVLHVPCEDDETTTLAKFLLACEFLHRNVPFLHVYRPQHDRISTGRKLINQVLPHLYGKQYGKTADGYFVRKDLLPLLFQEKESLTSNRDGEYISDSLYVAEVMAKHQVSGKYIR